MFHLYRVRGNRCSRDEGQLKLLSQWFYRLQTAERKLGSQNPPSAIFWSLPWEYDISIFVCVSILPGLASSLGTGFQVWFDFYLFTLILLGLPDWIWVLLGFYSMTLVGLPTLSLVWVGFSSLTVDVLGLPHWPMVLLGFSGLILIVLGLLILLVFEGFWPVVALVCLAIGFFAMEICSI